MPLVSISDAQRRPLPFARWQGTVHHGLPRDLYSFHGGSGSYLAFLGRLSRDKRVDRAIEIARRVGMPLKIAAKFDHDDRAYLDEIRPLLDDPLVEFVGEIGEAEKDQFLGGAAALLFPIDWPEPFGLVMVEAMACGTPVVAFRQGSVPEVVRQGVSGFVVDDIDEAVSADREGDAAQPPARATGLRGALRRAPHDARLPGHLRGAGGVGSGCGAGTRTYGGGGVVKCAA